jgi:hypothetical protein
MNSIAFWVYPSSIKLIWVLKKVSIEFSTYIDSIQTQTIHTTINFFHPLQNLKKKPSIFEEILFPNTIQTSKRVEWAHALLKMFPMKSLGDITMLTLIFIELHKKFQKSIISREPRCMHENGVMFWITRKYF